MRISVTGSREWDEIPKTVRIFKSYEIGLTDFEQPEWSVGDCPDGVDRIFTDWHQAWRGYDPKIYYADWDRHGRAAGPIRNAEMLDDFKPDLVIAFFKFGAGNRGTGGCVSLAGEREIPVTPYWLDNGDIRVRRSGDL